MRAWLEVLALTSTALADPPGALGLARERTALLDGRVTLQLAQGMVPATPRLDWGSTRFTLELREIHAGGEDLRALAARAVHGVSRIERLQLARPWLGYAVVPQLPTRIGTRTLVLAAYIAGVGGAVEVATFFIDEDSVDERASWAALARQIASTIVPTVAPVIAPVPTEPSPDGPVPPGWTVEATFKGELMISPRVAHPWCEIRDHEDDARSVAPATAQMVHGHLRGTEVSWSVWDSSPIHYAEVLVAARRWGTLHVICAAHTDSQLEELRAVTEDRFAEP